MTLATFEPPFQVHAHAAPDYPEKALEPETEASTRRKRKSLVGLDVDLDSYAEALAWMCSRLLAADAPAASVAFLNAHNLNVAWADPDYRNSLQRFDRVYPDGIGLRVVALLAGISFFENLSGTDLVPSLLNASALLGRRVFILGDTPAQMPRIQDSFRRLFPDLALAGYHHGYFDEGESPRVVNLVNASDADILLVGMGTPRQEKWLARHAGDLNPRLRIAVGGLFQYWDGRLWRAPAIVRQMKLEWAFILLQQPHRWRRYVWGAPLLLWRATKNALHGLLSRP